MARIRARFFNPNEYAETGHAPVAVIDDVLSWSVTMTQVNRFDGHSLELATVHRAVLLALAPFSTVDIEQRSGGINNTGLGIIGRGVVIAPEQQVRATYQGTIVLTLPNITDQGLEVSTGTGYLDANPINQLVANLGALTSKGESVFTNPSVPYGPTGLAVTTLTPGRATGWSASYLDDGTLLDSAAPVRWAVLANATANGNTVTRVPGGAGDYNFPGSGGSGVPIHTDVTQACALAWQIVIPTVAQVGLRTDTTIYTPDWGFDFSNPVTAGDGTKSGTWRIIAGRAVLAGGGTYPSNSSFSVSLGHPGGVATMQYRVNSLLVYNSPLAPVAPFIPTALIATPGGTAGGEVGNAIMSRTVPASQAWYQVQYDKQTQVGALLQLAGDTGLWVRQAADAAGNPLRAYELGPMNAAPTVTLRDGRGGNLDKLRANPAIRVVTEITAYKSDVSGVYTVSTPLGAGQGEAQVKIDLLWGIINDITFQDSMYKYGGVALIFPEYDPAFTIHRAPTAKGYEYYLAYEPAFGPAGYAAWLRTGVLPPGYLGAKEGGPTALSQIAYPPQATLAQQEATQRLLYKAWIELMKRAVEPHVTVALTTIGDWRPPKAGDRVTLDYAQVATDAKGPWTPAHITGTSRVLSVTRSASGDAVPTDTVLLSNLGKYEETAQTQAAAQAKQIAAIQVTNQDGPAVSHLNPAYREIDAAHPVVLPFYFLPTTYRVVAFYLILNFFPFRQTVTATSALIENATGTPVVTVGGVDIVLPTPADINALAANIGDVPGHTHQVAVVGFGGANAITSTTNYVTTITSGGRLVPFVNNNNDGGYWKTNPNTIADALLDPTAHPHAVAKKGDTIAHIPAGTVLADLPRHFHPAPADIAEEATPSGITIQIDSGDGVFVERTAQLVDIRSGQAGTATGFTGPCVLEIARFMDFPGRFLNVRLSSMPNATNGRGAVCYGGTVMEMVSGPGAIVNASQ